MIKVAIVRDESPYGERSYKTIRQKFETKLIHIESPSGVFIDNINLDKKIIDNLSKFDIIITYIKQADMTLEIVENLHNKVSWIIIGIWKGEGFKNQLLKYKNVSVPDVLCELESHENQDYNEFVSKFGKPEIKINCQNERIIDIEVLKSSPCGATNFVANGLIGKKVKGSAKLAGLRVQHYPCKSHKIELFATDEESHKQLASKLHHDAVKKALNENLKKFSKN
ncbi:MAG: hypothetical protein FWH29_03435 [Methanobrevibacter sp.]|nr:hypothetical protein [Methanobrevibacter sp.]